MTNQAENCVVLLQKIINSSYILVHTASPHMVYIIVSRKNSHCASQLGIVLPLKPQNSRKNRTIL